MRYFFFLTQGNFSSFMHCYHNSYITMSPQSIMAFKQHSNNPCGPSLHFLVSFGRLSPPFDIELPPVGFCLHHLQVHPMTHKGAPCTENILDGNHFFLLVCRQFDLSSAPTPHHGSLSYHLFGPFFYKFITKGKKLLTTSTYSDSSSICSKSPRVEPN